MKPMAWLIYKDDEPYMLDWYTQDHRKSEPLYTADQLRQAKVEVLREAAEKVYSANEAPWTVLERMADEIERSKT